MLSTCLNEGEHISSKCVLAFSKACNHTICCAAPGSDTGRTTAAQWVESLGMPPAILLLLKLLSSTGASGQDDDDGNGNGNGGIDENVCDSQCPARVDIESSRSEK